MLLLYAVRMVRTGIERSMGSSFRRFVTTSGSSITAAATGVFLAMILQSSAAVALLAAGFVGSGTLAFSAALPIVLGADLGSALVIQVLSFDLQWLIPVLLAIGGGIFIKSNRRKFKQAGRIILGVAFILISLRYLRETMIPIRHSDVLPAVATYLDRDLVTAFLAGACFSFLMHSSVAAILMCVTIVAVDALPLNAGVALVLGANLGSALIPVWLSRAMPTAARRVPLANLLIRGVAAVAALFVFMRFGLPQWALTLGNAQALINVHVFFNCMLMLAVPFCQPIERPVRLLLPEEKPLEPVNPILRPALDERVLDKPALAVASLRREVLRMAQLVENMFEPVMELYSNFDLPRQKAIRSQDAVVNRALEDIKRYVAAIPDDLMSDEQREQTRELTEYAIALETAGDIVGKQLLVLAQEKAEEGVRLSRAGNDELNAMHCQILENLKLAMNLLISGDLESARLLLEEKTEMVRQERASRKKHLKRLSTGSAVSFDSSNVHLETLRSLNQFNSRVASLAYPILYRGGQLLETRLIEDLDDRSA